jgi:methyl-accepting chemotaxis protein
MSRSISSAINRRAGNNAPRPNVPQNQQPAYNPKIAQQQPQNQGQGVPKNVRFVPSGQGQPGQQQQQPIQRQGYQEPTIPVKTAGVNGPVGQVSISDAFALVTIRLGRVEQFVQQIQEEGIPLTDGQPDLKIDTDLKNLNILFQTQEDTIHTLTKKIENYESTFLNYDKEIRDLKDMILTMTMKNEKNTIETANLLSTLSNSVKAVEDSVKSVEDSVKAVEDTVKVVEDSVKVVEDSVKVVEDSVKVVEDSVKVVENSVKAVEEKHRDLLEKTQEQIEPTPLGKAMEEVMEEVMEDETLDNEEKVEEAQEVVEVVLENA